MTWRVVWYIAGRWYEARADRARNPNRAILLRMRAEKYFRRAGL